jgi:hypothetical protein
LFKLIYFKDFTITWILSFQIQLPVTMLEAAPGFSGFDPEFNRLKKIKKIRLDGEVLAFVEKAHSSFQSRGGFKGRDCFKRSLLHYAAMGECIDLLLFLLQTEPKIDSRDRWGRTPLSWAAEYGSLEVVKILLEKGANVNATDYKGSTPLTFLTQADDERNKSLPATKAYLIERGAKEDTMGGIKLAWIWFLTYSRLLPYIRPRV